MIALPVSPPPAAQKAGGTEILHHSFTRDCPTWGAPPAVAPASTSGRCVLLFSSLSPTAAAATASLLLASDSCPLSQASATPSPPPTSGPSTPLSSVRTVCCALNPPLSRFFGTAECTLPGSSSSSGGVDGGEQNDHVSLLTEHHPLRLSSSSSAAPPPPAAVILHAEFGPSFDAAGNKCPHVATPSPPRRSLSSQHHHHRRSAFADGLPRSAADAEADPASSAGGAPASAASELVSRRARAHLQPSSPVRLHRPPPGPQPPRTRRHHHAAAAAASPASSPSSPRRPPMSLQLLSMDPLLCIVDGFLSPEECAGVRHIASPGARSAHFQPPAAAQADFVASLESGSACGGSPRISPAQQRPTAPPPAAAAELRRSRVTDGHVSSGRISQSTFLTAERGQLPLVQKLEARIAELFASAECVALNTKYNGGHFTPVVGAEPIQA